MISNIRGRVIITHATYSFLSLLPTEESLAVRGKRLNDTVAERRSKVYGMDVLLTVDVEDNNEHLVADFNYYGRPMFFSGEQTSITLTITNAGKKDIREIWIVPGDTPDVWLDLRDNTPGKW